jgi:hypothetical protein
MKATRYTLVVMSNQDFTRLTIMLGTTCIQMLESAP